MTEIAIGVQAIVALLIALFVVQSAALGVVLLWLAIQSAGGALASRISTSLHSRFPFGLRT